MKGHKHKKAQHGGEALYSKPKQAADHIISGLPPQNHITPEIPPINSLPNPSASTKVMKEAKDES
jgi:hypothetical protein